jgi:ribosomal protein L7/L12
MDSQYKQVIKIMASQIDYKKVCVFIAQEHPEIFCDAYEIIYDTMLVPVQQVYAADGLIAAIKFYRGETGEGLKDSKRYVEARCQGLEAGSM